MQLNTITNPYHLECLIKSHSSSFSEFDQKFLVNMLSSLTYKRDVTQKQFNHCVKLIEKLKTYEKLL